MKVRREVRREEVLFLGRECDLLFGNWREEAYPERECGYA